METGLNLFLFYQKPVGIPATDTKVFECLK